MIGQGIQKETVGEQVAGQDAVSSLLVMGQAYFMAQDVHAGTIASPAHYQNVNTILQKNSMPNRSKAESK